MGAQSVSEKSRTKQLRPGVCVSGGKIIQRDTVNFIPGSGTITAADNPANHTVDVTYTAPTGGLVGAYLQAPNNLSEVVPSIARTNLGLDTFIDADHNAGTVGATAKIDWATYGGLQHCLLTASTPCTLTFTAPSAPCEVFLRVQNPGIGTTPAITWPASVIWAGGGGQPTVVTTATRSNTYRFVYDGTTYWGDVIPSLGTAAGHNIGTSGATVPLLNAINTWGATQAAPSFQFSSEAIYGPVGASATVDWSAGGGVVVQLTSATACTFAFTAPSSPCWLTMRLKAAATGTAAAVTFPATVKWAGGTAPAAPSLTKYNVYRFYFDGTNYTGDAIVNAA